MFIRSGHLNLAYIFGEIGLMAHKSWKTYQSKPDPTRPPDSASVREATGSILVGTSTLIFNIFLGKQSENNISAPNLLYVCSPTADTLQTICSQDAGKPDMNTVNFRAKTSVNLDSGA